jgi:sulfite exporter TauE/SafE
MCGGLVTACTNNKKGVVLYQLGRLFGYSLLGLFAGTIGNILAVQKGSAILTLLPAITLGMMFILWGY